MTWLEGLLCGSAVMVAIGLAMMSAYEFYALYNHQVPPITTIVRYNIARHRIKAEWITALICLLAGWLVGHLGR